MAGRVGARRGAVRGRLTLDNAGLRFAAAGAGGRAPAQLSALSLDRADVTGVRVETPGQGRLVVETRSGNHVFEVATTRASAAAAAIRDRLGVTADG